MPVDLNNWTVSLFISETVSWAGFDGFRKPVSASQIKCIKPPNPQPAVVTFQQINTLCFLLVCLVISSTLVSNNKVSLCLVLLLLRLVTKNVMNPASFDIPVMYSCVAELSLAMPYRCIDYKWMGYEWMANCMMLLLLLLLLFGDVKQVFFTSRAYLEMWNGAIHCTF